MTRIHKDQFNNIQRTATLATAFLSLLCLPFSTLAYFHDLDTSLENSFAASSLGISLAITDEEADERVLTVTADEEEAVEYAIAKSGANGLFCADLELVISQNGSEVYNGSLIDFSTTTALALAAGDSDDINLQFGVANDSLAYAGDCTILFEYQANQAGYVHGEAFYDTELDSFILLGSDFGAPAPAGVVLNEILPNPEGSDEQGGLQGEWIEIYNNGATPVDLTGWYIKDAAGHVVNFTSASTQAGKMTIGVPGSTNEWVVLYMSDDILNNGGDTVYLYDNNDVLLDQYTYGPNTDDNDADSDSNNTPGSDNEGPAGVETEHQEGKSDARIPDGIGTWVDPEPTAGEPNYVSESELRAIGYSESMISLLLEKQEEAEARRKALEQILAAAEAEKEQSESEGSGSNFTFTTTADTDTAADKTGDLPADDGEHSAADEDDEDGGSENGVNGDPAAEPALENEAEDQKPAEPGSKDDAAKTPAETKVEKTDPAEDEPKAEAESTANRPEPEPADDADDEEAAAGDI